ncbi:hypothetical protein RB628_06065 [Streptomyces sp. ADMS]|uniref:type II toxin-antitoxin system VapC family toxin n=1 Tax=Streptomyces sp. ADMS TaxID=3071415 RepID=UPI0029700658|nr:hypothetical protein [Streptomyces sp. ADMS]MDW4904924.1 hypothetical protein [Streptomyces sp. ADMS]
MRRLRLLVTQDEELSQVAQSLSAVDANEGEESVPAGLLALIGSVNGPEDLAERHDDYMFNAADRRHPECASLLTSLTGRRLLPSPVMTEVCWLLERWPQVEAAFLAEVARGTFELVHLTPTDLTRMGELVLQYADFPLGGVDASVTSRWPSASA